MDIYNFPWVIYATDGSKGSTGMVAGFTGTISKEVGAAGSGETSVAARPAGPNLRQRVWLLKIPSHMTDPLQFSQIYTRGSVWASSPYLLKSEHIGASFSTKRQTDGLMKVGGRHTG